MIINIINFSLYVEQFEEMWYHGFLEYTRKNPEHQVVLNILKSSEVDITLDFKGNFLRHGNKLSNLSGKKILYFQDNLHGNFGGLFWDIEKQYDLIFLLHNDSIVDKQRYFHLSPGYAPEICFPIKRKKVINVCFVGTCHPGKEFIKDIPNIRLFGNGWGANISPIYKARKRAVYAKTKIMINQHAIGDTENQRCWECLAMKTFLLSDLVPKELEGGIVKYDGFDDLLEKIRYYLDNKKEREEIAEKGWKIVQPYTYEKRVAEMMEVILNAR